MNWPARLRSARFFNEDFNIRSTRNLDTFATRTRDKSLWIIIGFLDCIPQYKFDAAGEGIDAGTGFLGAHFAKTSTTKGTKAHEGEAGEQGLFVSFVVQGF